MGISCLCNVEITEDMNLDRMLRFEGLLNPLQEGMVE